MLARSSAWPPYYERVFAMPETQLLTNRTKPEWLEDDAPVVAELVTGDHLREAVEQGTFIKRGDVACAEGVKYDFRLSPASSRLPSSVQSMRLTSPRLRRRNS